MLVDLIIKRQMVFMPSPVKDPQALIRQIVREARICAMCPSCDSFFTPEDFDLDEVVGNLCESCGDCNPVRVAVIS